MLFFAIFGSYLLSCALAALHYNWTVPAGVYSIDVLVCGAAGSCYANSYNLTGGKGGCILSNLSVVPFQHLYLFVGSSNGDNGGGIGGNNGGGASDIRSNFSNISSRLVVGAGGGGCAHDMGEYGGIGGGASGQNGGHGGTATCAGAGATQTAGGAAASCIACSVTAGQFFYGGVGAADGACYGKGGGGGGGWYGGGGGIDGGGGGSSYSVGTIFDDLPGTNIRNGSITVIGFGELTYLKPWTDLVLTEHPTAFPTAVPTFVPSASPTVIPSANPTSSPTSTPSALPTVAPTSGVKTMSGMEIGVIVLGIIVFLLLLIILYLIWTLKSKLVNDLINGTSIPATNGEVELQEQGTVKTGECNPYEVVVSNENV